MYQYAAEPLLPWSDTDNDQRFNKVAKKVFIVFFILFIVVPFLPTPEVTKDKFDDVPPRFARLLIKEPIKPIIKKPKPKKIEKKKKVKKKEVKKKPKKKALKKKKPKPKPSAKEIAQSAFSGISDELADLRDGFNVAALKNTKLKSVTKRKVKFDTAGILTSKAGSSSGGITSSAAVMSGDTKLAQRNTTNVQSSLTSGSNRSQRTRTTGWSDEEIQLVFDRNKGAIAAIYRKALRKDPGLHGIISLRITLNSSGQVTKIIIVSSELNNKSLERRIKLRIKRFKFGAKSGASRFTFNYPLNLFPQ